jgi:sec-independent protein translocase protein TatA
VPFGISWWEVLILGLIILLIFGPKRLPEMGRQLGRGMREFKDSITGSGKDDDDADRAELPPPTAERAEQKPVSTTRERDSVL